MTENQSPRIIVVGASAAGLRAAARARRRLPNAQITVIDKDSLISYGACGMPYLVSGDIPSAKKLRETPYGVIRDPDFFRLAKGIEVITETAVERSLTGERLRQAMTKLLDDQREVIALRFVAGMPIAQVSQTLGKSEAAVQGLQRRALMALRDILADWEVEYVSHR